MKYVFMIVLLSLPMIVNRDVMAAEPENASEYVSRKEYESLRKEFEALKAAILQNKAAAPKAQAPATVSQSQQDVNTETQEHFDYIQEQLDQVKGLAQSSASGSTKFLISGYTVASFTDRKGSNSNFSTTFNPIFLWQMNDRLFFEGEMELELLSNLDDPNDPDNLDQTGETETSLEYANMSYLVNDNLTVGIGKFLTPFGTFKERLHPGWINKLPDAPLPFGHSGLIPGSSLGLFVRGGGELGNSMKGNYSFYLSNGPRLNTGSSEPEEAGMLHSDNFVDVNNGKAVGGRVGILPIPELEIGSSFMVAQVNPDGFQNVNVVLYGFDLTYVKDIPSLGGVLDIRAEWVFSNVENATYGTGSSSFTFDNKRNGGYAQIAYRPSRSNSKVIKNLEGVFRFDMINQPSDIPEVTDEQRYTLGLNYWLSPSAVLKFAYQIDDKTNGTDANAVLIQASLGF